MQELEHHIVTLRYALEDYLYIRQLKPATIKDYRQVFARCLGDWLDLPLDRISKDMVEQRHKELGRTARRGNGEAQANYAMRVLSAVCNFAINKYEPSPIGSNPVSRLSAVGQWNRLKRRRRIIKPDQMPSWWSAVCDMPNEAASDYFQLLMLTGLRRSEAATIKWTDVDFGNWTFTARDTKNGDDHELPMSDYLADLFRSRYRHRRINNEYVFPGRGPGEHLSLWYKGHSTVCKVGGVEFTPHDCRRTFLTVADSLQLEFALIKRLANHRQGDVTTGYLCSAEPLRKPLQRITDEILRQAKLR